MRIYTGTGDDGTTGLLFGGRVSKGSAEIAATGDADETQAAIGVARALAPPASELDTILVGLARDLYVLMAELGTAPANRHKLDPGRTLVTEEMVTALEARIDELKTQFEPITDFIIPGQTPVAAALDLARTVARRAERSALTVVDDGSFVGRYLNRLSDLLWTMARWQEGDHLRARDTRS
ncbi:MAG TPA: cob(I)yrinic acid a,c-diamide adenosyltransferase [Acidimicrobiales bacterium]|nr:cob(I)yrinic acid a,c-diamide adenosyltransferase [Acidimicrobiales bacterium]